MLAGYFILYYVCFNIRLRDNLDEPSAFGFGLDLQVDVYRLEMF